MANLSPVLFAVLLAVCLLVGLLIGYLIGARSGSDNREALDGARREHESFKSDVREHFEETAQIMSRMVHDYRDMYQHMAEGAERLAELNREKMVSPPPAPEAITEDPRQAAEGSETEASPRQRADRHDDDGRGTPARAAASHETSAAAKTPAAAEASPGDAADEDSGARQAEAASPSARVDRHADDDTHGAPVAEAADETGEKATADSTDTSGTSSEETPTREAAAASSGDKRAT